MRRAARSSMHLPRVHHRDAARHLGDHAHVVRDEHQRHAALLLQRAQQVEDLRLDRHVERGGGLVGDQQPRIAGDRHRDHHALVHAAGQLVREVAQPAVRRGDAHQVEQLDADACAPPRGPCPGADATSRRSGSRSVKHGIEARRRLLEDHRHVAADHLAPRALREVQEVVSREAPAASRARGPDTRRAPSARASSRSCPSRTRRRCRGRRPRRATGSRPRPRARRRRASGNSTCRSSISSSAMRVASA